MNKEQIMEKCRFYAKDALNEARKWNYETGTMRVTRLLNAEHSIGKYHAYMEVLDTMDTDACAMIHEETNQNVHLVLEILQNLYNKFHF